MSAMGNTHTSKLLSLHAAGASILLTNPPARPPGAATHHSCLQPAQCSLPVPVELPPPAVLVLVLQEGRRGTRQNGHNHAGAVSLAGARCSSTAQASSPRLASRAGQPHKSSLFRLMGDVNTRRQRPCPHAGSPRPARLSTHHLPFPLAPHRVGLPHHRLGPALHHGRLYERGGA